MRDDTLNFRLFAIISQEQTMTVAAGRTFAVGSLLYSRAGLVNLFVWLIWGDFVMVLMESVAPSLVPLLLKNNGANNEEIIVIVSTLAMVMNACLNPVISYKSDRFRSRWGRAPTVHRPSRRHLSFFFLLAIPYAPEIFRALHSYAILARLFSLSPVPALILVFGGLVLGFQTFHLFVGTTYYYLVPDVVPQQLLGRFYALFRIAGHLALITFNYFIFGFSQGHMKMIFGSIAVAYGFFISFDVLAGQGRRLPAAPQRRIIRIGGAGFGTTPGNVSGLRPIIGGCF